MSPPLRIECEFHFDRWGQGARKVVAPGPAPAEAVPGRVPRVARLLALAIRLAEQHRQGVFASYTEIASLGKVTRARISQIVGLVNLAPDIQEAILFLPRVERGRDPVILADLLPIAATPDWRRQRKMWADLNR